MINIVGVGPGHPDYIFPAAFAVVERSGAVAGGERHLSAFDLSGKDVFVIRNNLPELLGFIDKYPGAAVLASGDPGFYGILGFLSRHIHDYRVIPGLSTVSYMYARLGRAWHNARLISLHGQDFAAPLPEECALLTDGTNTPQVIARRLIAQSRPNAFMAVGEMLSYDDERITMGKAGEIADMPPFKMAVVAVGGHYEG